MADPIVSCLTAEYGAVRPWTSASRPRLSWQTTTSARGWRQAAAEIRLDGKRTFAHNSNRSVFIDWPFDPLEPLAAAKVDVRVAGTDGQWSEWSEPALIRSAALAGAGWTAAMLRHPSPAIHAEPFEVCTFIDVTEAAAAAVLYLRVEGSARALVNGVRVTEAELEPGWSSWGTRETYTVYDIARSLRPGPNELRLEVAGSWFTERYGFSADAAPVYGTQPAVSAQLVLTDEFGFHTDVSADLVWRIQTAGHLVSSGIYSGDTIDLKNGHPPVRELLEPDEHMPSAMPVFRESEPVRRTETRSPRAVWRSDTGEIIVDFGQNLVGWVSLRVPEGSPVTEITVRHAEVLEHGALALAPLRAAASTDTYLNVPGGAHLEPRFTFHGFRYASISGLDSELEPIAVEAVVLGSDLERTGWLETSSSDLNRLHENAVWSMRGNFLSVPTDCPQRDERLGWTGDIQMFAPTAAHLHNPNAFLSQWLQDLWADQERLAGVVPFVVPNVLSHGSKPVAAWGDAATLVPWTLFRHFADAAVLERQYPSMTAWVNTVRALLDSDGTWSSGFQFGDWLDPDSPPESADQAKTPAEIVATAFAARSAAVTSLAADVLGRTADAEKYRAYSADLKRAFCRKYVTAGGRMMSDSPTAYALALAFDLVEDASTRARFADRLEELVEAAGYRIGTGFVGTPHLLGALSRNGKSRAAGRLLMQTRNPSWLYQVRMGATTTWERWDSLLPDFTVNSGSMTSFNHYALGSVAEWMYEELVGLAPTAPGWARFRIAPHPIAGISHASARQDTPYGQVEVRWSVGEDGLEVTASVPPNAEAVVALPDQDEFVIGSGSHRWVVDYEIPDESRATTYSRDSSLRSVLRDAATAEALDRFLEEAAPGIDIAPRMRWVVDYPLSDALFFLGAAETDLLLDRLNGVAEASRLTSRR